MNKILDNSMWLSPIEILKRRTSIGIKNDKPPATKTNRISERSQRSDRNAGHDFLSIYENERRAVATLAVRLIDVDPISDILIVDITWAPTHHAPAVLRIM